MTLEDALDRIGQQNMAVAVQAAGLACILDEPAARETAEWIHSEALVTHRLICQALHEARHGEPDAAPRSPAPVVRPHRQLKLSR